MHQVPCPSLLTTWGVSGKTWHQPSPNLPVPCCRFVRGTCKKTDGSCPFSHHVSKEKVSAVWSAGLLFQMFLGAIQPSDILGCIVFLGLKLTAPTSSIHTLIYSSSSSPLHSHGPLCCAVLPLPPAGSSTKPGVPAYHRQESPPVSIAPGPIMMPGYLPPPLRNRGGKPHRCSYSRRPRSFLSSVPRLP